MSEPCPFCNGDGWTAESEHDPECPGDEAYCANHCPVQIQVQCRNCEGLGRVGDDQA